MKITIVAIGLFLIPKEFKIFTVSPFLCSHIFQRNVNIESDLTSIITIKMFLRISN